MQSFPVCFLAGLPMIASSQVPTLEAHLERARGSADRMEAEGLAEPCRGIEASMGMVTDLYRLKSTGVSTAPICSVAYVFIRHLYPLRVPNREHVHSVVRTPNGNDYGKDLLRQHYLSHAHGTFDANGVAHWHD